MMIHSHFEVGKLYRCRCRHGEKYAVMLILKAYNEAWPYDRYHVKLLVLNSSGMVLDDYFGVKLWEPMETT